MPQPFDATDAAMLAWSRLQAWAHDLNIEKLSISPYTEFLASRPLAAFSLSDRKILIDQSRKLFRDFYVHMPFKRELGRKDSITALDEFDTQLDSGNDDIDDAAFHARMRNIFVLQADAHTYYGLPSPYEETLLFLPFRLKLYFDGDQKRYIVSTLMPAFDVPDFQRGAEIVGWDGRSFEEALIESSRSEIGCNQDAFEANGLTRMTLRPLRFADPPGSPFAHIVYRPAGQQETKEILIPWAAGVGFNKNLIFPPEELESCAEMRSADGLSNLMLMHPKKCALELSSPKNLTVDSSLPDVFEFEVHAGQPRDGYLPPEFLHCPEDPSARIGYIRIKSFRLRGAAVDSSSVIANEFARILRIMVEKAPDGLILDIRGNAGGSIPAAEMMLQMLCPDEVLPANFHWLFTDAVRKSLMEVKRLNAAVRSPDETRRLIRLRSRFSPWVNDLNDLQVTEPKILTRGLPLTETSNANGLGQIYQGAIVLLVDAFTYSAADIFAGGFKDHKMGTVFGVSSTTGGGGASKWKYEDFKVPFEVANGTGFAALPGGVEISMAIQRSTRVKDSQGVFIEDLGVTVDIHHKPTLDDALFQSRDLFAKLRTHLIANPRRARLKLTEISRDEESLHFRQESSNVDSVQFLLGMNSVVPVDLGNGSRRLSLPAEAAGILTVRGFDSSGKLLVTTKIRIPDKKVQ